MAKKHRIDNLLKRLERRAARKSFRSVLFLTKDNDNKMYDFWAWKEKGEFIEIDTKKMRKWED